MGRLLIDYGATRCRYLVENEAGDLYDERASRGLDLYGMITELSQLHDIDAVHIAYAGQVIGGDIHAGPNVADDHTGLKAALEKSLGIPVKIENDLKCAALAEYHAYSKATTLFAAYIGTGFGGAVVEEGRLLRGSSNMAGEIGHIPFKKAPFLCGCGKDDCVEIYCSGQGLAAWVEYYGLDCEPTLEAIGACDDEKAPLILQNFYHALSHAVATAVTLFNPSHLILGGSVVLNNPDLETYVRDNVEGYAFGPAAKDAKILVTTLNNGCLEGTKWL